MQIRRVVLVAPAQLDTFPMRSATLPAVAAAVPDGVEVEVIDGRVEPIDFDGSWVREGDVVGLSFECFRSPRAYKLADALRKRGVPVIAGGAHPSAATREALAHVDAVVRGEVEGLWEPILDDLAKGRLRKVYAHKKPLDLSILKPPRFDLLKKRGYAPASAVEATRGCPHHCGFCSNRFVQGTYRPIPVDKVLANVAATPHKWVVFMDDNLPASRPHAKKLFEGMKGMGKRFLVQTHVLMAEDEELLKLAHEAGCRGVFVGLESVNANSLQSESKSWNRLDKYEEWIARFHANGIGVSAGIIFGLDDDDPSVFERTLEFTAKIKIDTAAVNLLVPFPGTDLHARMTREGRILDHDVEKYFGQYPLVKPLRMSVDQLVDGYRWFCQQFYSWGAAWRRWRASGLDLQMLGMLMGANWSYRGWRDTSPRPIVPAPLELPAYDAETESVLQSLGA